MDTIIFIFVLVSFVASFYFTVKTVSATKELEDSIRNKLDSIIHEVKVEQHKDTMYWFDKEDDKFIAQGQTLDEIKEVLRQRFPKHIFVLDKQLFVGPSFDEVNLEEWAKTFIKTVE